MINQLYKKYFNPSEPYQFEEDSADRYFMGASGLACLAAAGVGYKWLQADSRICALFGAAGALFYTSAHTKKSGYAWLVGFVSLGGFGYQTVKAFQEGRFFVHLNIDLAEIIKAFREKNPTSQHRLHQS